MKGWPKYETVEGKCSGRGDRSFEDGSVFGMLEAGRPVWLM